MEGEKEDNAPVRINGALMPNYLHAKAILVGFVTRADPDGKKATLKTTDEQFVQIVFMQPLNFILQPNQLIEAYGTVTNYHQFQCEKFTHFMPEVSANFNSQIYNKFIQYYLTHLNRLNIQHPVDEENETVLKNLNNNFEIDWNNQTAENLDVTMA